MPDHEMLFMKRITFALNIVKTVTGLSTSAALTSFVKNIVNTSQQAVMN